MSKPADEFQATVRPRRRPNSVWVVPLVALLLAGWLLWKDKVDKGPLATIVFETAEGVYPNKTEVRCRSVPIGIVETVSLATDLKTEITIRLHPGYDKFLRSSTRFWVVRPRFSSSSISGLGTFLTGAYIELDPGSGGHELREFLGLENPPVTPGGTPGLRLSLVARETGSLSVGSPVYYRGFEVGKVERRSMNLETGSFGFDLFISDEYAALVHKETKFWNSSGFDVTVSSEGFKFRTPSVQALITGGVSFSTDDEGLQSPLATDGDSFVLHTDQSAAEQVHFHSNMQALLLFDQSVRGLTRNATVEFRGIQVGRVVDISFKYAANEDLSVPVLIELDTSVLHNDLAQSGALPPRGINLQDLIDRGLRAKLSSASLLTGALYIDLDFSPDSKPVKLAKIHDLDVIPTESGGIAKLEESLHAVLAKLNQLPLEDSLEKFNTVADAAGTALTEARDAIQSLRDTTEEAKKLLGSDATQNVTAELNQTLAKLRESLDSIGPTGAVQGDLRRTLDELRGALRSFDSLANTIEDKPNSLIFGRKQSGDPVPRARR